ncbi:MAG: hypothetical protein WCK00_09270 [Deltaproteobacteria bacterium]
MKIAVYLLVLIMFSSGIPALHAQEYGKIRALNQRAVYVINQRNDFVAQVLTSYTILHERNEQGVVVRIKVDGQWLNVTNIEIVPVLKEIGNKQQQVSAHKLFFYTADGGILDLLSELTIH